MIEQREWLAMDREERRGVPYAKSRGLCSRCYRWAHCHNALYRFPRKTRSVEDTLEEWVTFADHHRSQRENARLVGERIGVKPATVERAVVRARKRGLIA